MKKLTTKSNKGMTKLLKGYSKMKYKIEAIVTIMLLNVSPTLVYGKTNTADDKWNTVIDFILPWVQKLGGALVLVGAVEWGMGFKNDNADGKQQGIKAVISGCIVFAVGTSGRIFL